MARFKIGAIVVVALLLVTLIWQNTEPVETRFLFVTLTMPRAALLATTGLGGFILGLLVAVGVTRSPRRRDGRSR